MAFEVILSSLSGGAALAGKLGKLNKLMKVFDKVTPDLSPSQKRKLKEAAEQRKDRAQNKEIDRRKKQHGDAFDKDADEVLRDPEIRRRDTEGKQMAKKEGRDLETEAEDGFDKESDGPKEKHDPETKDQKIKALASAKAIEMVDDAADVPIETLMGHLKPLAHIKGVQRFDEVPKGENRWTIYMFGSKSEVDEFENDVYNKKGEVFRVSNRREALNKAKERAGIPKSQQFSRQWEVGNDPARKGMANYRYSEDKGSWGRMYEYDTPEGKRVIVEHTADGPKHTHAGMPKDDNFTDFKQVRYKQVGGKHHIYYE